MVMRSEIIVLPKAAYTAKPRNDLGILPSYVLRPAWGEGKYEGIHKTSERIASKLGA